MSLQLSIEVHRFKISRSVWHSSKSRKIVAYAEFVHRNKVFRSRESQVYTGSQYNLPWNEAVDKITLHFFYIDALLTVDVGTAVYEIGKDKKFAANGNIVQVILDINIDGCSERIGRVMCNMAVQGIYDGERNTTDPNARRSRNDDRQFAVSAPDFRFKQLNRPVHWDRIRGVNIDRCAIATIWAVSVSLPCSVAQDCAEQRHTLPAGMPGRRGDWRRDSTRCDPSFCGFHRVV